MKFQELLAIINILKQYQLSFRKVSANELDFFYWSIHS